MISFSRLQASFEIQRRFMADASHEAAHAGGDHPRRIRSGPLWPARLPEDHRDSLAAVHDEGSVWRALSRICSPWREQMPDSIRWRDQYVSGRNGRANAFDRSARWRHNAASLNYETSTRELIFSGDEDLYGA